MQRSAGFGPSGTIERAVWMTAVLCSGRVLTREDYDARFGSPSLRTFRRDLDAVRSGGLIVEWRGWEAWRRTGGYSLVCFRPEAEAS